MNLKIEKKKQKNQQLNNRERQQSILCFFWFSFASKYKCNIVRQDLPGLIDISRPHLDVQRICSNRALVKFNVTHLTH